MDLSPQAESIAQRFRCAPDDPILGVIEAVVLLGKEIKGNLPSGPELAVLLTQYTAENTRAEELAKNTARTLFASLQVRTREKVMVGLLGMGGPLLILIGAICWYETRSLDAILSSAHINVSIEKRHDQIRLSISGKKLLRAGQDGKTVVSEFGR